MGSFFSHPTGAEVLKKNQEYISEMNKIKVNNMLRMYPLEYMPVGFGISQCFKIIFFQMERWIQMHYQIKEREAAMQISRARELFYWLGSFYCVATVGLLGRYNSTRRSAVLGPIVPLTFLVAYYADLAYGTKVHRIIGLSPAVTFVINH